MLPPRWVRRVVLAPLVAVLVALALTSAPLVLLGAAAVSPLIPGRWRPLRFLWVIVVYAALELAALVVLLALWVATGFGRWVQAPWSQRTHYGLVRTFLRVLHWEATRVLGARVEIEAPADPGPREGPVIVLARHAGAGDSFLVVDTLLSEYGREPRIVLKDVLQWDPALDTVLNRLPNRFISAEPGRAADETVRRIGELAAGLDHDDALVIFPEGGNFTPARRVRAIARLRTRGHLAAADRAARMRHVLAPRPGGVTAAVHAAPEADVVLVVHTGLEQLSSLRQLWEGLPMDRPVHLRWWRVAAAEVPRTEPEVAAWLDRWWTVFDAWIEQHRTDATGGAPPDRLEGDHHAVGERRAEGAPGGMGGLRDERPDAGRPGSAHGQDGPSTPADAGRERSGGMPGVASSPAAATAEGGTPRSSSSASNRAIE